MIPRSRAGMLWRALAAVIVIVACTTAATAVAGLLQFKQLAQDISQGTAIPHADVTPLPAPGAPQTILVIGSDHRAGDPANSFQTDTMLLVRLNDSSDTINVLSVPRDLKVTIPGVGISKLNAAYSDGGPNLLLKTIRANVFPQLRVNHIVDINFAGFADLVNAIGCVYGQVDHRYYNLSQNNLYNNYSSIDIQPGYQKLCGGNNEPNGALSFVRFRHTDSDIVRNARQQTFIRWAKSQYSTGQLLANRDKLLAIFGRHVHTDPGLHSLDGLIGLFDLVLNLDGHTIKSVPFPAILQPCVPPAPCYVTADPVAEQATYRTFMTPTHAAKPKPPVAHAAGHGRGHHRHAGIGASALTGDLSDGLTQASHLTQVPMAVFVPKLILGGSQYCSGVTGNCDDGAEPASEYADSYPRAYMIRDKHGTPHAAYVMTLVVNSSQGQYYNVQGTTWQHPPLLASPSQIETIGGRRLELYYAGGKLMTVAWRTPTAVYWIANTLTGQLGDKQMLAIAASLTRAPT